MKKKIMSLVLAFFVCMTILIVPAPKSYAQYNDAKYDNYKNMTSYKDLTHAAYIVPNLYRQDASYTNVRQFPLVVSDGIAYAPMEIFVMFSYIQVVYSKVTYGFYLNNTITNRYISFNLETNSASTNDAQTVDGKVKIFHSTYYLPAKLVCDAIGLKYEFYDNPETGICAVRVYDNNAVSTLSKLVDDYSPKKLPEQTITPGNGGNQGNSNPADPYESIAQRNIYITYENLPNGNTESILTALRKYGAKATFFVTAEEIYNYPDTVRKIITEGHTLGLFVNTSGDERVLSNEEIFAKLSETNDALYTVTKRKTRYVRVSGNDTALKENGFDTAAFEKGYIIYSKTYVAKDYRGNVQDAYDSIIEEIAKNKNARRTIHYAFGSFGATDNITEKLLEFCSRYNKISVLRIDENTVIPSM